jgi:flavin-binding protein dodecin
MTRDGPSRVHAAARPRRHRRKHNMSESVYKVIELIGTSTESWEKAATAAVETASQSLRDLRIAEIAELDMQLEDGKVRAYRARVRVSFKFQKE